ncbi:histidine-type phosphatase [Sphingobium sp. BYY-5]|uniref:histidine-type phosphatase n=1 Tax=Sphingobium sp. BYY-5 TaxID=2926400 RepID=UPI001FA7CE63|nr:histidine-type phosphatase [Sphingobium sp. BYY-5]MCI4588926.1 histidine-type phosphatase [Sphingobium sp. BYY-5]
MRGTIAGLLLATMAVSPVVVADAPPGLTVDRAVLLMRHGVRPPTKAPAMPAGVAAQGWPDWPVNPGWLTPHGADAIGRIAAWDGGRLRSLGLLPAKGCPAADTVRVIADSDQRTIATADRWIAAVAPGCRVRNEHKPQDAEDPLFNAIGAGLASYDPARVNAAVAAAVGPGGIAALDARYRPLLTRLDVILCGSAKSACGVSKQASAISPAAPGQRPKLSGALDRASTASQILLLEYAEGKAASQVGWGRAKPADITALSAFHALEFALMARPVPVASASLAGLAPLIRQGLTGPVRVTLISGHDTNVANLGGLLDIHWRVPGLAADDPAPGGAIVIERLRDTRGALYVRALYRSQTLEQMRSAASLAKDAPYAAVLPIPGCAALGKQGLCTLADFERKLSIS